MVRAKHVVPKTHQYSKSLEAKGRFRTVTSENNIIPNKGFHLDCLVPINGFTFQSNVITSLSWDQFCAPRGAPDIDLVREFYANI